VHDVLLRLRSVSSGARWRGRHLVRGQLLVPQTGARRGAPGARVLRLRRRVLPLVRANQV